MKTPTVKTRDEHEREKREVLERDGGKLVPVVKPWTRQEKKRREVNEHAAEKLEASQAKLLAEKKGTLGSRQVVGAGRKLAKRTLFPRQEAAEVRAIEAAEVARAQSEHEVAKAEHAALQRSVAEWSHSAADTAMEEWKRERNMELMQEPCPRCEQESMTELLEDAERDALTTVRNENNATSTSGTTTWKVQRGEQLGEKSASVVNKTDLCTVLDELLTAFTPVMRQRLKEFSATADGQDGKMLNAWRDTGSDDRGRMGNAVLAGTDSPVRTPFGAKCLMAYAEGWLARSTPWPAEAATQPEERAAYAAACGGGFIQKPVEIRHKSSFSGD